MLTMVREVPSRSTRYSIWVAFGVLTLLQSGCIVVRGEHYAYRSWTTIDESKLRLDGYYWQWRPSRNDSTTIQPIVLWSNGAAAYYEGYSGALDDRGNWTTEGGSVEMAHQHFLRELRGVTGEMAGVDPAWGGYRLGDGTITIQVLRPMQEGLQAIITTFIYEGIILNDTTFTITSLHVPDGSGDRHLINAVYYFRPIVSKPDSRNWTMTHSKLQ